MFMGEYNHTIDKKGRLIVPVKLREGLGDKFVVTRGLDVCLFAYPLEEWAVWEDKLKSLPITRSDARAFKRVFYSAATEVEKDKQGRILIPQNLRDYARLENEVVIIGVSDHIEIWSESVWKEYSSEANASFEDIAGKLVDFDL